MATAAARAGDAGPAHAAPRKRRRGQGRRPTLYDAVAGLIRSRAPRTADGSVSGRLVLAPDEAVYRARNAPLRYEETDTYFAHERLPVASGDDDGDGERVLPDSDLLAAVHRYTSQFYEALAGTPTAGRLLDERSMDETALLAMGILLEEASRELLGRQGDVVFTEGGEEEDEEGGEWETDSDDSAGEGSEGSESSENSESNDASEEDDADKGGLGLHATM